MSRAVAIEISGEVATEPKPGPTIDRGEEMPVPA
jgi:hypothetical protein